MVKDIKFKSAGVAESFVEPTDGGSTHRPASEDVSTQNDLSATETIKCDKRVDRGNRTMKKDKKSPLSYEFMVATEIFHYEINDDPVSYSTLLKSLEGYVSKNTLSKALDTLLDWGIVKSEYGATKKGRPGKLLRITNESKPIIKDLYYKYWRDFKVIAEI